MGFAFAGQPPAQLPKPSPLGASSARKTVLWTVFSETGTAVPWNGGRAQRRMRSFSFPGRHIWRPYGIAPSRNDIRRDSIHAVREASGSARCAEREASPNSEAGRQKYAFPVFPAQAAKTPAQIQFAFPPPIYYNSTIKLTQRGASAWTSGTRGLWSWRR